MVPVALLVLAAALHALLPWRMGAHRLDLDHDATISDLAPTGHQGDYERLPLNTWMPAREIQRLFQIDEVWPLRRIRDDLARTDIHPPLYFWLLHTQLLATGATAWALLIVNGLLGVLTMLTVYSIGRRLWDQERAAGAALLWAVSFGALLAASEAGPYVFSALFSIVLIRLVITVRDRGGRPSLAQGVLLALLYAGHVARAHAVGGRYNATLWPLFGLLITGAVRDLSRDPICVVRDSMDIRSVSGEWSRIGAPVTFLFHRQLGNARVRRALKRAAVAEDSVVSAGPVSGGTEVVVWTPAGVRSGAATGR